MLFVGIAIGMIAGDILHDYYGFSKATAFLSMVFFFGGLSLILNFVIELQLARKK